MACAWLNFRAWLLFVVPGPLALAQSVPPLVPPPPPVPAASPPAALPLEEFPRFGGVSAEQFGRSNVSLLAAQLLNELRALQGEVARSTIPPVYKPALNNLVEASINAAENVRNHAIRNTPLAQLQAADLQLDAAMERMGPQVARFGNYSRGLMESLARVQQADAQLHAAIHQHGGGPRPEGNLVRIRRAAALLDDQAETLRDLSRGAAQGAPALLPLDRAVRRFSFRVPHFSRAADEAALPVQLQPEFQELLLRWRGVLAAQAQVREPAAVRVQINRVDSTMRALSQLIPGNWDWGGGGSGWLGRGAFAVGAGAGGGPRVRIFANQQGDSVYDFFAYEPEFTGGVRVALADLTGDGIPDLVTAPGPGLPALIRAFDGRSMRLLAEFYAFDLQWRGGAYVAAAARTRDGRAWLAVSADAGAAAHVKVYDLAQGRELDSFFAFDETYRGGCRIAFGDVNGDGWPDLIAAPGAGAEPRIRIFSGVNREILADFLAFDRTNTRGLSVSAADFTRDGRAEVIAGTGPGGPASVRIFEAARQRMIGEIAPFPRTFLGGVRVSPYDLQGSRVPDLACAPGEDANQLAVPVRIFSGVNSLPLAEFFPFGPDFRGGAFIASQ